MTTTTSTAPAATGGHTVDVQEVIRVVRKRSYAVLATVSPASRSHAAGVLYVAQGTTLYVNTNRHSRKARNIAENPYVGVTVPVRRLPVGPPSAVQFQAEAEIFDRDDPHIRELIDEGRLKGITSHGELDDPENCFLRISPRGRISTYGIGMSLRALVRDPLGAAGSVAPV